LVRGMSVAVLGAAGLHGENLLQLLVERQFPFSHLSLLDEAALLGKKIAVGERWLPLLDYEDADLRGIDLALVCDAAGAGLLDRIREQGGSVIAPMDCCSGEDLTPVVAGVNTDRLSLQKGMCIGVASAEATLLARLLSGVQDELGLRRVNVQWVRSVSADGRGAVASLAGETGQLLNGKRPGPGVYPHAIAFNLMALDAQPLQDEFADLWYRLWGDDSLVLSIGSVLAPVFFGEMISVSIEVEHPGTPGEIERILCADGDIGRVESRGASLLATSEIAGDVAMHLAPVTQADRQGRQFNVRVCADVPRVGFALNQIKIAENFEKFY
jgi:aspartate-semialdehyde dehydrogenase